MTTPRGTTRERIHRFFDRPSTVPARLFEAFVLILVVLAVVNVVIELAHPPALAPYEELLLGMEPVILVVFTIEYLLRVGTAPRRLRYATRPLNVIDFLAVFPSWVELALVGGANTTLLRAVRLVARVGRVARGLKLLRHGRVLHEVLGYQGTILREIAPVIVVFLGIQLVAAGVRNAFDLPAVELGELFAILGFALGIILAQKVGATYDKFLRVEEAAVRVAATLRSLILVFERAEPERPRDGSGGEELCRRWGRELLELLDDPAADDSRLDPSTARLYAAMARLESTPAEMAVLHGELCRDAAHCLAKKSRLTPKPYDLLLRQATMLYLLLIAVFLPGLTGTISVVLATYILWGMYHLTLDLDSIVGGEFSLINVNLTPLRRLVMESTPITEARRAPSGARLRVEGVVTERRDSRFGGARLRLADGGDGGGGATLAVAVHGSLANFDDLSPHLVPGTRVAVIGTVARDDDDDDEAGLDAESIARVGGDERPEPKRHG